MSDSKSNDELRARLAAVVETSDDAIITKTLDGIITTWNASAERIFGYKESEIVGKSVTILMPPERVNEEPAILARLRRGERVEHYETVRKRKNGDLIHISLSISPLLDSAGHFIGASKIARDITDRKRIESENARLYEQVKRSSEEREQLLEAERSARAQVERASVAKDEFLATLSHELRTPLNAILGWSQVLKTQQPGSGDLLNGITVIERNARIQVQLIEDLLDMSRIISGKIRLDIQQVDLQDVMQAAVASIRHSADAKSLRMQIVIDPLAGPVRGDPARLQQCFWNLLTNAIKFTPKGGTIQVTLERVNSHLEAGVSDNGIGINPEFLPLIFQRFSQQDSKTTRKYGGLGLGLSIVKHLIELHGGTIRAKSAGENKGAAFLLELPLMAIHSREGSGIRTHPRAESSTLETTDLPSLVGVTVLVVDDERDARELVKRILEDRGATVLLASSGEEGVELLKSTLPNLILSDIGMPGEDGYDFIRKVRKLPAEQGGSVPAAALTAFARAEDRTKALRAGFQTHVAKPVEPIELTAVVASLASKWP